MIFILFSVRHEAARSVLWYLTQDPDRGKKLPSVSNPVLTDMADLYLMEYPVVLDDNRERSVFQVNELLFQTSCILKKKKVKEVFRGVGVQMDWSIIEENLP